MSAKILNFDAAPKKAPTQYDGGRYLKAIRYLPLMGVQKAVLRSIGSMLDFKAFDKARYIAIEEIVDDISFCDRAVRNAVKALVEGGYVLQTRRKYKGQNAPSFFRLTDKVFAAYREILEAQPAVPDAASQRYQMPPASGTTYREDPKYVPKEVPIFSASERRLLAEAKKIWSLLICGPLKKSTGFEGREELSIGYLDRDKLKAHAELMLEQHGIEAMRLMRCDAIQKGIVGEIPFNPRVLDGYLAEYGRQMKETK